MVDIKFVFPEKVFIRNTKPLNSADNVSINMFKKRKVAPKRKSSITTPPDKKCKIHQRCNTMWMELGYSIGKKTGIWEHFSNRAPMVKKNILHYKTMCNTYGIETK